MACYEMVLLPGDNFFSGKFGTAVLTNTKVYLTAIM
jgi:hypothetical protein